MDSSGLPPTQNDVLPLLVILALVASIHTDWILRLRLRMTKKKQPENDVIRRLNDDSKYEPRALITQSEVCGMGTADVSLDITNPCIHVIRVSRVARRRSPRPSERRFAVCKIRTLLVNQ